MTDLLPVSRFRHILMSSSVGSSDHLMFQFHKIQMHLAELAYVIEHIAVRDYLGQRKDNT